MFPVSVVAWLSVRFATSALWQQVAGGLVGCVIGFAVGIGAIVITKSLLSRSRRSIR